MYLKKTTFGLNGRIFPFYTPVKKVTPLRKDLINGTTFGTYGVYYLEFTMFCSRLKVVLGIMLVQLNTSQVIIISLHSFSEMQSDDQVYKLVGVD